MEMARDILNDWRTGSNRIGTPLRSEKVFATTGYCLSQPLGGWAAASMHEILQRHSKEMWYHLPKCRF